MVNRAGMYSNAAVTAAEVATAVTFADRLVAEAGNYGPGVVAGVPGLTLATWTAAQNNIAGKTETLADLPAQIAAAVNAAIAPLAANIQQLTADVAGLAARQAN